MNTPLVSIIVPCYNYAHFLRHTLENVLAQQYSEWECIIIDDGSTDDTAGVAGLFTSRDKRFRYIHQHNMGLSGARNTGIAASKGVYLQLLDSDDLLHPAKLAKQVAILEADPAIDITYGNSYFFHTDDPETLYPSRRLRGGKVTGGLRGGGRKSDMLPRLMVNNIMEVSCALLRSRLIGEVGWFDETYRSYEDWHFWIRCALHNALFDYSPLEGTDTYIRTGHQSMMTNKGKLVMFGIRIRSFLDPHLSFSQRLYNRLRLLRLYIRTAFKIY
ncbi:MAG TPA: glycosyltransferase family A protein [Puia sp.]|jgi:glycosyltransferase involved in cell wall biosynthesis|nr:glycosyltransferase family A protein [Puia sp.]